MVELFYESIIQQEIFQKAYETKPLLIPIPLHWKRFNKRGYNHSKLLADGLSKSLNLRLAEVLQRTKKTKSQFGLKLKERKENLKNAFSIVPNVPIAQYPNIFLVDDILTTGSTLLEAARILKKNGARKVWGLTLARD
ncbi:MAG: phosphoribosyltransferase family protein [Candidatus Gracilibacteria bacterium]